MTSVISPVNIESRKKLDLRSGDTVRVHQKIEDKGKTRIQIFEGMVLSRKHGTEAGATFTVRRSAGGFGVEKIYPLYSPMIDKIEITKRSKTRRGKLYYIRDKALKQIRKRMKMMFVEISDEVKEKIKEKEESESTEVEVPEDKVEATETSEETKDTNPSTTDDQVGQEEEVVEEKKEDSEDK